MDTRSFKSKSKKSKYFIYINSNSNLKNAKKGVEMPLPPIRNKVEIAKKELKKIDDPKKSAPSKKGDIFTADEVPD